MNKIRELLFFVKLLIVVVGLFMLGKVLGVCKSVGSALWSAGKAHPEVAKMVVCFLVGVVVGIWL